MFLYEEFYTTFVNLIWGSREAFSIWSNNISVSTNNWLLDAFNAILLRLPDIATILFLVLVFFIICWLPIVLYKIFKNLDPEYRKYRGRK